MHSGNILPQKIKATTQRASRVIGTIATSGSSHILNPFRRDFGEAHLFFTVSGERDVFNNAVYCYKEYKAASKASCGSSLALRRWYIKGFTYYFGCLMVGNSVKQIGKQAHKMFLIK